MKNTDDFHYPNTLYMPKGTSQAEASEKMKFIALAVIKLCLTEGTRQSASQAINQKKIILHFFLIPWQLIESILGRSES